MYPDTDPLLRGSFDDHFTNRISTSWFIKILTAFAVYDLDIEKMGEGGFCLSRSVLKIYKKRDEVIGGWVGRTKTKKDIEDDKREIYTRSLSYHSIKRRSTIRRQRSVSSLLFSLIDEKEIWRRERHPFKDVSYLDLSKKDKKRKRSGIETQEEA